MAAVDLDSLIKSSQVEFRVDVVELAKKLNLQVFSVNLPDEQSGHICYPDDQDPYIEVNRNHPVTRQRFTIAHEISHYLKHRDLLKKKGQLDRKLEFADPQEAALESEADQTASRILMPEKLVDTYFGQKGWSQLTRFNSDMVTTIAHEFRVSRTMAVTRLRELGFTIPFLSFA